MSGHVDWVVLRDRFPQIATALARGAEDLERRTAETWRDAARAVLYPGHGEVSGYLKSHIEAEGGEVRSTAEYSGPVNDGHGTFAGYGFWDQGEMEATSYFEDQLWEMAREAAQA